MSNAQARISFQMTGEDYAAAQRFKNQILSKKLGGRQRIMVLAMMFLLFTLLVAFCILTKDFLFLISVALLSGFGFLLYRIGAKMAAQNLFATDQALMSMQTVELYPNGVHLINGFEKLFVPWHDFFAVKETKRHVLLLCDAGKQALAIDKNKVEKTALATFLSMLESGLQRRNLNGTIG